MTRSLLSRSVVSLGILCVAGVVLLTQEAITIRRASAQGCHIATRAQFDWAVSQGLIAIQKFNNASFNIWAKSCTLGPVHFSVNKMLYFPPNPRWTQQEVYARIDYPAMTLGEVRNFGGNGASDPGCGYQIDAQFIGTTWETGGFVGDIVRSGVACRDDAVCEAIGDPAVITPGLQYTMLVQVRNTGNTIWRTNIAFPYRLMSTNPEDKMNFGINRIELPSDVGPGQTTGFQAAVTAPTEPGTYTLDWQMGQEGVKRFGTICHKVIVIAAASSSSSSSSSSSQSSSSSTSSSSSQSSISSPSSSSSSSSSVSSSSSSSAGQMGCIDVLKEAFDPSGNTISTVPQFTFRLDGAATAYNGSDGKAHFQNVPVGSHTVTEEIPSGWQQLLVTPANGTVNVPSGNSCVAVVFKNKQTVSSSFSSYSSSSSSSSRLTITKTDHESFVEEGDTLTYDIVVRNEGSATARDIEVVDELPDGVSFIDASSGADERNDRVRWRIGDLQPGESEELWVEVEVVTCDEVLRNRAEIVGGPSATDTTDTDCGDDHRRRGGACRSGDLRVTKSADRSEAQPGDIVEYTVNVRNDSNRDLGSLDVEDRLEAGGDVTIVDAGGADVAGQTLRWRLGRLDRSDSETFRYALRLGYGLRHGDIVTNRVRVDAGQCDETASTQVHIIEQLPQTGFGGWGNDSPFLTKIKQSTSVAQRSGTGAVLFWLSWVMGVAGFVGGVRKFF